MFDCPDPSQTSPTSTSLIVIGVLPALPVIVIVNGAPAFAASFASFTIHLPSASAVANFVWPAIFTVTFSPASAVPHTGTVRPFCSTMWSLNKAAGFISARAAEVTQSTAHRTAIAERVFMESSMDLCSVFPGETCSFPWVNVSIRQNDAISRRLPLSSRPLCGTL